MFKTVLQYYDLFQYRYQYQVTVYKIQIIVHRLHNMDPEMSLSRKIRLIIHYSVVNCWQLFRNAAGLPLDRCNTRTVHQANPINIRCDSRFLLSPKNEFYLIR
jgi:hypothetical protein